jgi:hypothetical protein
MTNRHTFFIGTKIVIYNLYFKTKKKLLCTQQI